MTEHQQSIDHFLTTVMSHDIANANQTIRGYLEMLLDEQMGSLVPEQSRVLEACLRQSRRIQSLIESVRLLHQLMTAETDIRPQDLDHSIREAIDQIQSAFADREVRVRFNGTGHEVLAEKHLTVLFRQLLSNAVQHSNAEVVQIELAVVKADAPTPSWTIRVTDNGPGIPAGREGSIFNRLDRRDIHGSGLGLCLARALVDRWQGEIRLERGTGASGATFCVTLPAA